MLFRTVYGPELESLYLYIHKYTQSDNGVYLNQIHQAFLPSKFKAQKGQAKNIEDALVFLKTAGLIVNQTNSYSINSSNFLTCSKLETTDKSLPFALLLLRQFQLLLQQPLDLNLLDLLYISLLDELYIKPNLLWISDVHTAVNSLELAQKLGGISQEKVGAWKRVMEFLGLGYRMGSGFYCLYQPQLLKDAIYRWPKTAGTLQEFLEDHLQYWLPCFTARGDLAQPLLYGLDYLAQIAHLKLRVQQDSPSRPYFGTRQLKGIELV